MKRNFTKLRLKENALQKANIEKSGRRVLKTKFNVFLLIIATLFFSKSSNGQISVVGSTTNTSSATSISINRPTNLQVGDLMIANITQRNPEIDATSTGWTNQTSYLVGSPNRWATILYKVAASADVSASSFTFTITGANAVAGGITAFRGVNTTTNGGIEAVGTPSSANSAGPIALAQITTLTNNAMILFLGQISGPGITFTSGKWTAGGVNMTQAYTVSHPTLEPSAGLAYLTQATAGATGAGSKAISASARWGGVLLALTHSNTASAASSTPTICINTALTNITHSTTGATGIGTATGLPAGVTAAWVSNTITISGTPTESGTFNYNIPLTGGYGSVNATGTITVNAATSISTQPSDATICFGGTYSPNVVASGGVVLSYQWQYSTSINGTYSNVANSTPANATYANATTSTLTVSGNIAAGGYYYKCVISGTGGCSSVTSNAVTLTINADPTIGTQPSNATICSGGTYSPSVVVSGGTALSYQWQYSTTSAGTYSNVANGTPSNATYSNATTSSLTVSGTIAAGSYYYKCVVSSTASGCGTVTSSFSTLTVNALPTTVSVTGSGAICSGSSTTLTASNASSGTIYWQNTTSGGTSTVTASASQSVSSAGTYYFRAQSSAGCWGTEGSATVTVNALPTAVTVTGGGAICSGSSTTLTASNGSSGTIYWQNTTSGGTSIVTGSTSQSVSSAGTYYFRARSSAGCWGTEGSATVTMNAVSVGGTVSGGTTICSGSTSAQLTLSGNTGSVVKWQSSTDGTNWTDISNTSTTYTSGTLTQTTQFRAVLQSGVCSSANSSSTTVTVNQPSVAPSSITGTTTICNGSSTTLTAAGGTLGTGANYQWGTGSVVGTNPISGATSSTLSVSPTSTTSYWVRIENNTSPCTTTTSGVTATVTVNSLPTTLSLSSNAVCTGATTSISSTTSVSGVNYQLYNNSNVAVGSAVAGTGSGLTWSGMAAGSGYYVIGTNATTSCTSTSSTVTVTVNALPTITLSYIDDVSPLATSFSIPYTAVSGSPNQYSITTASNSATSIAMTGFTPVTNASLTSSPLSVTIPQSSAAEYGFYFTVTNSSTGCSTTYPFQFHVTSLSHGVIGADQTICYGTAPATLNSVTAGSGAGDITYSWEQSTTSVDAGYTAIPGANGASYSPSVLTQTTYFKRVATNGLETSDSDPVTITVAYNWLGLTSNWHTASNWCTGVVPSAGSYVVIPVTANNPVINAAATCGKITIQSSAGLTINNGYALSVYGDFDNSGTVSNNGSIKLLGTAAQTFPGAGSIGLMSTLEFNNAAGVTLNNNLSITTELKPTAGTLNLSNYDITLKSSVNATASVSALGATAAFNYNGTGRFVVERYINTGGHAKAWHLLSAPTQGGQTIHAAWMEGAAANANPNPGYGIIIGSPAGTAGGFDLYTPQAVMKTYVPASNSWVSVANPKTTAIGTGNGYMIFIRSDRRVDQSLVPTILRTRGTLQVGTINPVTVSAGLFQTVGNPYPSAITIDSIIKKTGIAKSVYLFDPSFAASRSLGGYQTINAITGYLAVPGGTQLYNTVDSYHKIESGQAFMLKGSTGATVTFKEAFKAAGSRLTTRVNDPSNTANVISMLRTNLIAVSGTTTELTDGNAVVFDDAYANTVDDDDAPKPINAGENFGLIRDGYKLSVEAKSSLNVTDTLFYDMSNLRQPMTYRLQFIPQNLPNTNWVAELIDNYTNTKTAISLTDTSSINIATNSNTASTIKNRFMLVFRSLVALPVSFTSVSAVRQADQKVMVRWTVDNEINMDHYTVEKSEDGKNFSVIASPMQPATHQGGMAAYDLTDSAASMAANYYRIKAVSIGGQIQYSSIVKVAALGTSNMIEVFPNPIADRVANIYFHNQPVGNYKIFIYNNLGQLVLQKALSIQLANQSSQLSIPKDLPLGKYQMTIVSTVNNTKTSLSVLIK